MKITTVLLFAALFIVVFGGAKRSAEKVIDAQEFQLRDANGKLLAFLGCDPVNGIPSLQLFDPQPGGVVRSVFSTDSISFNGKVKKGTSTRLEIGMVEDNQAALRIRDDQGKHRFDCGVAANNDPYFILRDREEKVRASITINDDDVPVISLQDAQEKGRMVLGMRDDGSPTLSLNRLTDRVSLGIDGGNNRPAGISLIDQNGRDLVVIKVEPNGHALIKTSNEVIK
jgi:hypothetical protein